MDWSDVKYFLAMAEAGSLSSAARELRVSQPTLSRRLTALEEALGAPVFSRKSSGLELTAEGESLLKHAQRMSDEALAIERIATGQDTKLSGRVTITAVESIGAEWLTQELYPFHLQYPDIELEIKVDDSSADLMRREADIAVRMYRPTQPDLIAKKIAHMHYRLYTTQKYIDRRSKPKNLKDIAGHDMVLPTGSVLHFIRPIVEGLGVEMGKSSFNSSSATALIAATRAGYGIGIHSSLSAMRYPDLIPLFPDHQRHNDIWLVTHADVRRSARIRAAYDFLSELFNKHKLAISKMDSGEMCEEA